jgi:hypothetical protein
VQRNWIVTGLALAGCWLATTMLCADPVPPTEPPAARNGAAVSETKPELLYIKDKNGNLTPVLGFTLDDFDRLIAQDAARQQGPTKPTYKLDKLVATGLAKNGLADLKIRFTIQVDDPGWVRVPLRMSGAVLRDKVTYTGPGEYRLDFDEQAEEYIAWLKGKSDKPHVIEVQAVSPLTTVAGESRLRLSMPRAWSSELTFTAPQANAVGQVSSGATIDTAKQVNNTTEFHVLGVGNDFSLTWRAGAARAVNTAAVLETTGAIQARIDGRSVNSQARLTVRSFGGEFETFRVRLPKGAVLIAAESADYTLAPIAPAKGKNEPVQVEVRLKNRTTGPINVQLETEQMVAAGDKPVPIDLAGFEVLGAVRQWGHIAVQVEGDWQLLWDTRRSVRQVDSLPPELDQEGVIAGFEYFAQPFALAARVVAKESRVHVEPRHLLLVHGKSAELETRLKFRVGGARVHAVQVDLTNWNVDSVEPDVLVNRDQLVTRERSPLSIPLRQGTAGEFEIVVRAHRDVDDLSTPLAWNVPQVKANTITPAQLVVVPDDDVDLEVQEAGTQGLVRQYVKPTIEPPPRQQAPLVFQVTGTTPMLTTAVQLQQRTIGVTVDAKIQVKSNQLECSTALNYQIARQAVDHVLLQAPAAVLEQGQLDILLDDVPLTWSVIVEPDRDPQSPQRLRVGMPGPKIGTLRLEARTTITLDKPLGESHQTIRVPLIMPAEGDFRGATTAVESAEGVSCHPGDGFWTAEEPVGLSRLKLASRVPRTEIALDLHTVPVTHSDLAIDRCWLQTFVTSQGRVDRLALVVTGAASSLSVTLPSGSSSPEATRNGTRVTLTAGHAPDQLLIPLEKSDLPQRIELKYRHLDAGISPMFGATALNAPQFAAGSTPRQTYWQLILGPDDHLVSVAGLVTQEHAWAWRGWRWGRWPVLDQAELEAWSGASPQPPIAEQAHVYLVQSHDEVKRLTVVTARRAMLVLLGTGSAMLLGLAWIYWPQARRAPVILAVALLVSALAIVYPEPASVMAQLAVPGTLLAAMAAWLKRRSQRHSSPSVITRAGSNAHSDRLSTRTHIPPRPASVSVGSGTATAQFPVTNLGEPTPSAEAKT